MQRRKCTTVVCSQIKCFGVEEDVAKGSATHSHELIGKKIADDARSSPAGLPQHQQLGQSLRPNRDDILSLTAPRADERRYMRGTDILACEQEKL